MPSEHEFEGIKRASRRWHSESVGTQLLRALAEAEERDAAAEKRAVRIEVKPVTIMAGAVHGIGVQTHMLLELLCLELEPAGLEHLTCRQLRVGSQILVEGAPLSLLNRAWLSRLKLIPGVGLFFDVENHSTSRVEVRGSVVGIEPKDAPRFPELL